MSTASAARTFEVRHVQLSRALFAAIAAVMITFSPDHSAAVGLSVFSGFAIATGLVLLLALWLVYPSGRRWPTTLLAILTILAGMASGISAWRTNEVFFVLVIAWAVTTGAVELVSGWRALRPAAVRPEQARFAVAPMPRGGRGMPSLSGSSRWCWHWVSPSSPPATRWTTTSKMRSRGSP